MRILGLDPGSRHTGYGVVEARGDRLRALAFGRLSVAPSTPLPQRLHQLGGGLSELLGEWRPDAVVLEALFHGINSRSLIVLAQARGALLASVAATPVEIREYSPAEVKSAVTGNGRADKTQVQRMVRLLLSLGAEPLDADAADALAVAICFANRYKMDRLEARDGSP